MGLQIAAPSGYANSPTTIKIQSFIGNYYGRSAHDVAGQWVRDNQSADPNSINNCSVAGDDAAFVQYSTAGLVGYQVFIIRVDRQTLGLARLWGLSIEGSAGLDPQAIADAKKVLGSWQWDK